MRKNHDWQAYKHHWNRFNKRSIVTCHYVSHNKKSTFCSMYARVIDTFIVQGVRFYRVKPSDSYGKIADNAQAYDMPTMMLKHTGRRVKST